VLIVDDHAVVREGIKRIVESVDTRVQIGEAANASAAWECVRKQSWDLVLLDLSLPGPTGLDLLSQLMREYPKLPVLVLSMHPEDRYGLRVLRAGAAGYLTKDSASEQLTNAIRIVLAGGRYISHELAMHLTTTLDDH
jgi:DNA-binding NarL/FixJ family response regulator